MISVFSENEKSLPEVIVRTMIKQMCVPLKIISRSFLFQKQL